MVLQLFMSLQVQVTSVPEYFNFWEGKPLLERDFSVRVQKRKPWRRPKSDYGNRLGDDNRAGGRRGGGVLETVVERDSAAGSEYGDGHGGHGGRGRQPGLKDGESEMGGQLSEGDGGKSQVCVCVCVCVCTHIKQQLSGWRVLTWFLLFIPG